MKILLGVVLYLIFSTFFLLKLLRLFKEIKDREKGLRKIYFIKQ